MTADCQSKRHAQLPGQCYDKQGRLSPLNPMTQNPPKFHFPPLSSPFPSLSYLSFSVPFPSLSLSILPFQFISPNAPNPATGIWRSAICFPVRGEAQTANVAYLTHTGLNTHLVAASFSLPQHFIRRKVRHPPGLYAPDDKTAAKLHQNLQHHNMQAKTHHIRGYIRLEHTTQTPKVKPPPMSSPSLLKLSQVYLLVLMPASSVMLMASERHLEEHKIILSSLKYCPLPKS